MEEEKSSVSCKDKVMSRIECEEICPRSKTFFTTRECGVWVLWAVSVVVGALAFAVMSFTLMHHQYAFYEATHQNFYTFLIEALPYLWISTFALMAGVAVYNLRHTKHGYRYPLWQIFGSSVVLSLAGGAVLHLFGFGFAVDHMLGKQMPMYASQEKLERRMWQNPEDGRLIGRVTESIIPPAITVTFEDVEGRFWKLDLSELEENERELLFKQGQVKIIGIASRETTNLFHSCGAFPWLLDRPVSRADFEATREAFEMKMHRFEEEVEGKMGIRDGDEVDRRDGRDGATRGEGSDNRRCKEMEFMRRGER